MKFKKAFMEFKKEWERVSHKNVILGIFLVALVFITFKVDNDSWFLLNTGRYILANGVPFIEPFTIHEGFKFMAQQWLFCAIVYPFYQHFGMVGLFVFSGIVCVATSFVIFNICRILNKNNSVCRIITVIFGGIFMTIYCCTRPSMVSGLLLAVELYFLEKYVQTENPKYLIALPVLSVLMINLHASIWLMLFVFMLPYFVNTFSFEFLSIKSTGFKRKPLIIAGVAMFAAGFINPYGIRAMLYVLAIQGVPVMSAISEMQPLSFSTIDGKIIFMLFFLYMCVCFTERRSKLQIRFVLLSLGTMVLTLMVVRGFIFVLISAAVTLAQAFSDSEYEEKRQIMLQETAEKEANTEISAQNKKRADFMTIYTICIVFVVCVFCGATSENFKKMLNYADDREASVAYLTENYPQKDIVLYTSFEDGGYLELSGFRPYIDPRAEIFLKAINGKKDVFVEYITLQKGLIYYKDFLDRYDFTNLLVKDGDMLHTYLEHDSDYEVEYSDEDYYIYKKVN